MLSSTLTIIITSSIIVVPIIFLNIDMYMFRLYKSNDNKKKDEINENN